MKRSFRLTLIAAAAIAASLHAQEALPKGETILDKYLEATGRDAYARLKSSVMTGTMDFAAQGISGTIAIYRAEPNFARTTIELPGIGKIEEGVNGDVVWSNSAIQGPRLNDGEEKQTKLLGAQFNAELRWRDYYQSAETAGSEDVNGQPCYKVIVTPKQGSAQTRFYNKKTGLLEKTAMTLKTPMGEIPVETLLSDYKDEGGLKMAHKITQSAAGQTFVITISSVKNNTDIPKSQFDFPPEIKALLEKK